MDQAEDDLALVLEAKSSMALGQKAAWSTSSAMGGQNENSGFDDVGIDVSLYFSFS